MATKNTNQNIALFAVIAIVVWGFVYFSMRAGPGATVSRASPGTTLTAGDDGLSLQQDLNGLQNDPTLGEETQLNSVQ